MKLHKLGARLPVVDTNRVKVLETKAGTTPRTRGDAWMKIRRRVLLAGEFKCVDCGHISMSNQVDHHIPLEQGGTDADQNLVVRCIECHKAKTAAENKQLFTHNRQIGWSAGLACGYTGAPWDWRTLNSISQAYKPSDTSGRLRLRWTP